MPDLICEVCNSTDNIGTYQGYGLNQILCGECAGEIVAAQNAKEREILEANRAAILQVIIAKKQAMLEAVRGV